MLVMMKDQGGNVTMAAVGVTTGGKHGEHGDCGTCSWDEGTPKGNLRTSHGIHNLMHVCLWGRKVA